MKNKRRAYRLSLKKGWRLRRKMQKLANMQTEVTLIDNNDEPVNFRVFVEPLPIITDSEYIIEKKQCIQNEITKGWINEEKIKEECTEKADESSTNDVEIIGWREWLHTEDNHTAENDK